MDTTRLGMTDLDVFPIAFGTWQLGGDWGHFDEREAIAAIRHARELGIDLFDTAQAYGFGASERLLGRALGDDRATVRELDRFARERGRTVSQLAIAWTLAHPAVDAAIVGARRATHIEDSVGAADFELSREDLDEIDRIMDGALTVAGPSPETT
jgi:aryl-alcohol dehydrogenase-like predicted oxidoreductase